jgi:hypothetical protein
MIRDRIATVRFLLTCLLVLAVLGFRMPVAETFGVGHVAAISIDDLSHSHGHHGHSHDDDDELSPTSGHEHDRFHIGDHSHDTPAAAVLMGFSFGSPKDQGPGTQDDRIASRPTPPGDRPPRLA